MSFIYIQKQNMLIKLKINTIIAIKNLNKKIDFHSDCFLNAMITLENAWDLTQPEWN